MNLRRNGRYVREFEMLWFCFSGARIFFRFDLDEKKSEQNAEQQPAGNNAAVSAPATPQESPQPPPSNP